MREQEDSFKKITNYIHFQTSEPKKNHNLFVIAEKKSMIQHSYSNPDEIMAIVDEINFVKTKGTREHMSSSV